MISPIAWIKLRMIERKISFAAIQFIHAWIQGNREDQHRATVNLFQTVKEHPSFILYRDGEKTVILPRGK